MHWLVFLFLPSLAQAKKIQVKISDLEKVNVAYLDLSHRYADTRQAKLLLHDYERTLKLVELTRAQIPRQPTPAQKQPLKPPRSPSSTGFPKNPLVK